MSPTLLNNRPCASSLTSFPRFGQLPVEVRLSIWRHIIPAQRIISIVIESTRPDKTGPGTTSLSTETYSVRNELGNLVSGAPYRIRVDPDSRDLVSPLLGVNCETRELVLRHYHVHIPTNGPFSPRLAIRPEIDLVHFALACWDRGRDILGDESVGIEVDLLPDFLSDARAYDGKGAGILHIAFGKDIGFYSISLPMDPARLSTQAAEAMRKSLLSFVSVTVVALSRGDTRIMFTSLDMFEARYNRALPLWASTANLQQPLAPDPRGGFTDEGEDPLAYHLEKVPVGHDPVGMFAHWQAMERAFGVAHVVTSAKQVAVASRPVDSIAASRGVDVRLRSRLAVEQYVAAEEEEWYRRFAPDWSSRVTSEGIHTQFGAENPDLTAPEARLSIPQAAGFWVVPAATLGSPPEGGVSHVPMGSNYARDLRCEEPRLALFDLNSRRRSRFL
ncbi:hypothetical protein ACKVWC_003259 [Pyricularia oryzae]